MTDTEEEKKLIREAFLSLTDSLLSRGCSLEQLRRIIRAREIETRKCWIVSLGWKKKLAVLLPCFLAVVLGSEILFKFVKNVRETRCLVTNNYFIWEFTRPIAKCDFCENLVEPIVLENLTRKEFEAYAYSSKPIIVKGAAKNWVARDIFNVTFFRDVYSRFDDAYSSIEDYCQFLQFRSNFENLQQVLEMSDKRASNEIGEESWYVGWKNCHHGVLDLINKYYEPPHFFPIDAEIPATNYIFLGYDRGAAMHLDYIPRLMWQGQLIGSKTWTVAPTPECENVCKSFNFSVETGDVILLDTRIWYHGTRVDNGSLSLTITSEYG